jgi:hypothetical protein
MEITMIFSIGIRDTQNDHLEGLCDIYLTTPMTVVKLQDIVQICHVHVIQKINEGLRDKIDIVYILHAIADAGCTVELDSCLRYRGTNHFADGVRNATIAFFRSGVKWPSNVMDYTDVMTPFALYEFLFWDFPISFRIGIITKSGRKEIICNATTTRNHLHCSKMIRVLESNLMIFGLVDTDIYELIEMLVLVIGGNVQSNPHYQNEGIDEDDIELIFVHDQTQSEMIYRGDVAALQKFLTAT